MISLTDIFFVVPYPIYNKEFCTPYSNFTKADSSFLYVTLLRNLYEIFSSVFPKEALMLCLHENDKDILSADITSPFLSYKTFFFDTDTFTNDFTSLFEKRNLDAKNFIFVHPDFVGLTPQDILQILDLLQIEDDVLVLKKSLHSKVELFATNKFQNEIPHLLHKKNFVGDSSLKKLCGLDYQLYKLKNVLSLAHVNDFKELYKMLSQKENYSCCSQRIHDRFTHLFIEYKELL
ncbi:MAG: hypothetical protein WC557_10595 [Ignavibacteriaceae bacterium]